MAARAALGNVFASPSTNQIVLVAKAAQRGGGVLFTYENYAGDVLNFSSAQDQLCEEGVACESVPVTDASASVEERHKRRGIAGDLAVFKIAGAAAAEVCSLADVDSSGGCRPRCARQGAGVGSLFVAAGEAWADRAGGTSGALWGLGLRRIGRVLGDQDPPTAAKIAAAIHAARLAMIETGGAQVGDKTLVDVLVPFDDTLSKRDPTHGRPGSGMGSGGTGGRARRTSHQESLAADRSCPPAR